MNTVGKRLRYIRKIKNLKLKDVKRSTGLAISTISAAETGGSSSMCTIKAILDLYALDKESLHWVIYGECL